MARRPFISLERRHDGVAVRPPRPTQGQRPVGRGPAPARGRGRRADRRPARRGGRRGAASASSRPAPTSPSSAVRTRRRTIGRQFRAALDAVAAHPPGDHRRGRRATRWAAAASWPWPAISGSSPRPPSSVSRRSCSASSRAAAAPSGWPGWSGRPGPRTSSSPAARSTRPRRCASAWPTGSCRPTRCSATALELAAGLAAGAVVAQGLAKRAIDARARRPAGGRARPRGRAVRRGLRHRRRPHRRGVVPRAGPRQGQIHRSRAFSPADPSPMTVFAENEPPSVPSAGVTPRRRSPVSAGVSRSGWAGTTRTAKP